MIAAHPPPPQRGSPPLAASGEPKHVLSVCPLHWYMPSGSVFELYEDNAGEWRWRLVVSNGNIIADSGEGYNSKQGAKRGIESVKRNAADADIRLRED